MPGLKRHIVSRWLNSLPSVHTAWNYTENTHVEFNKSMCIEMIYLHSNILHYREKKDITIYRCGIKHRDPSWLQLGSLTLTRWGRTVVIMDVYLSTTGGNPTSSWALACPALFMMYWDFLHQGTKCLYSSTFATTSYISCIENLWRRASQGLNTEWADKHQR